MSCPICCRFQSRSLYVFYTFCSSFILFVTMVHPFCIFPFFIIYSHRNIFLQLFIHSFSVLPFSLIFPVNLFNHYNTIFYFLSFLCFLCLSFVLPSILSFNYYLQDYKITILCKISFSFCVCHLPLLFVFLCFSSFHVRFDKKFLCH